jgi:putrescine transport system permease protein
MTAQNNTAQNDTAQNDTAQNNTAQNNTAQNSAVDIAPIPGSSGSFARRLVVWIPFGWLAVFFLLPFLIVVKISLSQSALAQPPYVPVFDIAAGLHGVTAFFGALSLDNYALLGTDPLYILSYVKSIEIAAFATLLLLVIGYPIAYGMARLPRRLQPLFVVLVMLPFWTAFLIRIYAWMNILQHDGPLNRLLLALGIVREPPTWLATDTAIYIGIVYSYLPFMVLPLYATLEKLDESLLEAAADLGCPRWRTFWLVTLPLSAPGVLAGALLCFIPTVGEFVIPDLLGGSQTTMIGQTIWMEFFGNKDWPAAAAVAVALVLLLVTPIVIFQHQAMRTAGPD